MLQRFKAWRKARVRLWGHGDTYIRFAPDFGFAVRWFNNRSNGRRQRIRVARHHGVQMVEWRGARWVVTKQIMGKSTVNKECFDLKK